MPSCLLPSCALTAGMMPSGKARRITPRKSARRSNRLGVRCYIGALPHAVLTLSHAHPLGPLLVEAHDAVDPPAKEVKIRDLGNQDRRFVAEAFFNQQCYFVMFAPAPRLRLGRRIKVAS